MQRKWLIDTLASFEQSKDTAMGLIYSNTDKPCPEEITDWFHGFESSPDSSIAVVVEGVSGRRRRSAEKCVDISSSGELSESSCPDPGDPVAGDRLVLCKIGEISSSDDSLSPVL